MFSTVLVLCAIALVQEKNRRNFFLKHCPLFPVFESNALTMHKPITANISCGRALMEMLSGANNGLIYKTNLPWILLTTIYVLVQTFKCLK